MLGAMVKMCSSAVLPGVHRAENRFANAVNEGVLKNSAKTEKERKGERTWNR